MTGARPDDATDLLIPPGPLTEEEARRRRRELLALLKRGGYNVEQIAQITGWAGRTIRRDLGNDEDLDAPAPVVGAAHPRGALALGLALTRVDLADLRAGLARIDDEDRDCA